MSTVTFNLVSQQQRRRQEHSQKPDEDDDEEEEEEPSQNSGGLRLAWSQTQASLGDEARGQQQHEQASDPPTDEDAEEDEEEEGQSLNMMPTGSVRSSQGARPSQEPVTAGGAALLPLSEQMVQLQRLRQTLDAERKAASSEDDSLAQKIKALQAYREERLKAQQAKEATAAQEEKRYVSSLTAGMGALRKRQEHEAEEVEKLEHDLKRRKQWLAATDELQGRLAGAVGGA